MTERKKEKIVDFFHIEGLKEFVEAQNQYSEYLERQKSKLLIYRKSKKKVNEK